MRAPETAVGAAAAADAVPPPLVAKLSNGISIEILGVSEHPSVGRPWWSASGLPLPNPVYQRVRAQFDATKVGDVAREFAIRVQATATNAIEQSVVDWHIENYTASGGGTPLGRLRKEFDGVQGFAIVLPDSSRGAVLHADIASGEWTTIATIPLKIGESATVGSTQCTIGEVTEQAGRTRIKYFSSGLDTAHVNRRWTITDSAGVEYPANMVSMNSLNSGANYEVQADLPLASIAGLRFQVRPYTQWIEIRNISLHLNQLTDVKIVTSDDAPSTTRPQ